MSRITEGDFQITQGYSSLKHRAVDGVKYKGQTCNILAHSSGQVVWVQKGQKNNIKATGNASYGNCVKIKHPNGMFTLYAHLKSVNVKLNEYVEQGQIIGYMGNTGNSYGAHLHWEVRNAKDTRIDPTQYINNDLPNMLFVTYEAYDNKKNKWLPKVQSGTDDYAGNKSTPISGIRVSKLTYQARDMVKNKWLPKVTGCEDYAGNLPNNIDAIRIFGSNGYRAYDMVEKRWLPWVYQDSEYAGNIGHPIGAIQIK